MTVAADTIPDGRRGVALSLVDVSKSFGATQVLKPLRLTVAGGELLALLGPSGCGKTTTLRLIAGFEMPDTGSILIGGRDVTELAPNRRGLGMVFQSYSLFPHMSVGENVAYGLKLRRMNRAARTQRVRALLQTVRLPGLEDRAVAQLSGGQQQRVALARALATDPAVLLLDEPLGALDRNLRESMQFELRELQRNFGITSILVTHDQEEALTMSDRVAVMAHGAVVQIGTPTEIYDRPRTRFVSEFLGTANIFVATVGAPAGPDTWHVRLSAPPGAQAQLRADGPLHEGMTVTFAVRPERLRLDASGASNGEPSAGTLAATVRDVVFRGSYFVYELDLPGAPTPVFAYSQSRVATERGQVASLSWDAGDAVLLQDAS